VPSHSIRVTKTLISPVSPPAGPGAENMACHFRAGEQFDVAVKVGGPPGHGEGAPAWRPSHDQRGMARPAGTTASGEG